MVDALRTRVFQLNVHTVPRTLVFAVILQAVIASIGCLRAENLSPVAESPDWNEVDSFQETLTRAEFVRLLDDVYAPRGAAHGLIEIREDRARIVRSLEGQDHLEVRFAR